MNFDPPAHLAGHKIFFIENSFRDVADADYISARVNFRLGQPVQFLWSAQQAIEKYLKAILLFENLQTKDLQHDLQTALDRVETKLSYQPDMTTDIREFIEYIDDFGKNRYKEIGYYVAGDELQKLDKTVWYLRRYCQPLRLTDGSDPELTAAQFQAKLEFLKSDSLKRNSYKYRIPRGYLEKLLDRKIHNEESRRALVWKNFNYSRRKRNRIKITTRLSAGNPVHLWSEELFEDLRKSVYFTKDNVERIRAGFRK